MYNEQSNDGAATSAGQVVAQSTIASIQKLDGKNFLPWKRQIKIVLKLKGLSEALENDYVNEDIDDRAVLILLEAMDAAHKIQVQAEPTAKAIMTSLEKQYADVSAANKLRLLVNFVRYTKVAGDSVNQHVGKLKEMRNQLANLNENYSEEFFQVIVINSVPEHGDFMAQWELVHPSMKTTEFLVTCLQQREAVSSTTAKQAFAIKQVTKKWEEMSIEERKKVSKCKKCQKKGHWARECTSSEVETNSGGAKEAGQKQEKPVGEPRKANIILNSGSLDDSLKSKWVLDSGATEHMSNRADWFKTITYYEVPKVAAVGDGKLIQVLGFGDIELESKVDDDVETITLTNVSYIPELATNLVSVGATSKRGLSTEFNDEKCQILMNQQVVVVGKLDEHALYVLDVEPTSLQEVQTLLSQGTRSLTEWHKVLGHPGRDRLKKITDDAQLGIRAQGELEPCPDCPAGKAHRAEHPSRTSQAALETGERVHLDIGFLSNKNKASYDYYLLCKDEYSSYCFIYFLDKKKEVHAAIEELIYHFEYGSGKPIRCIRSDNGSEFKNQQTDLLFRKNKIVFENSAPYVPQQNAMIEREMRTVNDIARTLLAQACLPYELEKEALRTACFLKNRVPTARSHITPFELFVGRKPYLLHLHEFGTKVQILDHVGNRSKLEARTVNGYIVGFTALRNTYRVYVPGYGRTIETCDIFFGPHRKERALDEEKNDENTGFLTEVPDLTPADETDDYVTANNQNFSSTPHKRPILTGPALQEFFDVFLEENRGSEEGEHDSSEEDQSNGAELTRDELNEDEAPTPPPRTSSLYAAVSLDAPKCYSEAVNGTNRKQWLSAIESELDAHQKNGTWQVVDRPAAGTTLTARWVFVIKRNIDGGIERFKARLVARGFEQRQGLDFFEVYAPVAKRESIRMMLAIAAIKQMAVVQFDIATAFLHGSIEEEIYLEPPEGVKVTDNKCLKLIKALYGLRQAPRAWNLKLNQTLVSLGLHPLETDNCVYTNAASTMFLVLYVDDGLLIGDSNRCFEIIEKLNQEFETKILKGDIFVGFEISKVQNGLFVSQGRYIGEVLSRFNVTSDRKVHSPAIDVKNLFTQTATKPTSAPYREALGCLNYIAHCTRPDLVYTVNLLSRYNNNPKEAHWEAVKHCLLYLKTTRGLGIKYTKGQNEIAAYSDANWAKRINGRYSTSGVLLTMAGGPVVFASIQQTIHTLSSTEAEYVAACETSRDIKWLTMFLEEIKFQKGPITLHIDNKSAEKQIRNRDSKKRSKHVELKYHFVRKSFENKLFDLKHIGTEEQPADILTKSLSGRKVIDLINRTKILVEKPSTKTGPRMGHVALTAMIMIAMLGAGAGADGFQFEKTDALVWRTTDYGVYVGTNLIDIAYVPVSVCDFKNETDWSSEQNVKKEIYDGLKESCQASYRQDVTPALEAFAKCLQADNNKKNPKKRVKRIIPLIWIVSTIVVVALVGTPAYSYWSPDSSYNRHNRADERAAEMNKTIATMKADLMKAQEVRNDTLNLIDNVKSQVDSNRKAIHHVTQVIPAVAITASDMKIHMMKTKDAFIRMTTACKNRQISPIDYADTFKLEKARGIKAVDSHLESVTRIEDGTFLIEAYISLLAENAFVYQIAALRHWVNVTTDAVLVEYKGPEYALVNKTSNCIVGVDDPTKQPVQVNCIIQDFRDARLNLWQVVDSDSEEFEELAKPQVFKTATESIVSCMFHDIIIQGKTYGCPHFPFKLPLSVEFEVANFKHEVKVEHFRSVDRNVRYETPYLTDLPTDPEYGRLLRTLREKNQASVSSGQFGFEKNTLTIPLDALSVVSMITVIGSLLSICTFIYNIYGRREQPPVHPEQIQVITAAPAVQPERIQCASAPVEPSHYYPVPGVCAGQHCPLRNIKVEHGYSSIKSENV